MVRCSRHAAQDATPATPTGNVDTEIQITEYERARNVHAKALRDEVELALLASGHIDVALLREKFNATATPH
jgi:hypothetical protein